MTSTPAQNVKQMDDSPLYIETNLLEKSALAGGFAAIIVSGTPAIIRKCTLRSGKGPSLTPNSKVYFKYYVKLLIDNGEKREILLQDCTRGSNRVFKVDSTAKYKFPYFFNACFRTIKDYEMGVFEIGPLDNEHTRTLGFDSLELSSLCATNKELQALEITPDRIIHMPLLLCVDVRSVEMKEEKVLTNREVLALAEAKREAGNAFYKQDYYDKAAKEYRSAIGYLYKRDRDEKDRDLFRKLVDSLNHIRLNLVKALVKLSKFDDAVEEARELLKYYKGDYYPYYLLASALRKTFEGGKDNKGKFMLLEEARRNADTALDIATKAGKESKFIEMIYKEKSAIEAHIYKMEKKDAKQKKSFMTKAFGTLYEDQKPGDILEELRKQDEEDKRAGRKVWMNLDTGDFIVEGGDSSNRILHLEYEDRALEEWAAGLKIVKISGDEEDNEPMTPPGSPPPEYADAGAVTGSVKIEEM